MRFNAPVICCLLFWTVFGTACKPTQSAPLVGFYKLDDQRLSGETRVIANDASFSDLTLLVTIDTNGKVTDAKPVDNFEKLDPAPGLALVRTWTFRPQSFEGKPVKAIGMVSIAYDKREIPAKREIPFPAGTPTETAITLERGACYGSCPDYRVVLHGDGLVEFDTTDGHFKGTAAEVHLDYNGHNVLLPGRHTAHVDPAAVERLIGRFRAANFFGLNDRYFYGATDQSTQLLTVKVGTASKSVTDYIGTMAGMPQAVRDLEEAVDEVAGTARWVTGNDQTLADLDAARFDFRSRDAASLTAAAAQKLIGYRPPEGVERLIQGLIDRGVRLDTKFADETLGSILVLVAAKRGSETLFDKLVQRGVLIGMPRASLTRAFDEVGCSPSIARALVKAGADPRAAREEGTPLTALRGPLPTCEKQPGRLLEMARTLVDLGVPLEARDNLGWTALMGNDNPDLVNFLLSRGANPRARSNDGYTTALSTDDDRVALILLRAGADPQARSSEGSLRAQASKHHMPATLAWLDAHGFR